VADAVVEAAPAIDEEPAVEVEAEAAEAVESTEA
jgi:hypothetical protein